MAGRVTMRRTGIVAFLGGAVSAAVVGGGVALASIPSTTTGSITGCVNNTTRAVRIVDAQAGHHCSAGETTLNWSKGYTYRGAWSASTNYNVLDVVTSGGSSYLARAASHGQSPAVSPASWGVLASRGDTGPQGPPGVSGYNVVTQYFTVNTGTQKLADVQCPAGQVPIGGGAHYG